MRAETKGAVKNSVSRLIFAALSVLVQVLWILYLLVRLNAYSTWISLGTSVLSFILVLHIYGREMNVRGGNAIEKRWKHGADPLRLIAGIQHGFYSCYFDFYMSFLVIA